MSAGEGVGSLVGRGCLLGPEGITYAYSGPVPNYKDIVQVNLAVDLACGGKPVPMFSLPF